MLKDLITSFTKSVDVYNYLLKNHHRRTAAAAYHIGKEYGLDSDSLCDLVIAAALHDIGALTVAERDQLIQMDIRNPFPHSSLGSYMLDSFDLFGNISKIVYYHHWRYENDQNWNIGMGKVPIESYILHVADRTDILIDPNQPILLQKSIVSERIQQNSGTLFHPEVVNAFLNQAMKDSFWLNIDNLDMEVILDLAISKRFEITMTLDLLEQFAFTLSKIIDSRSEFAISHSFGVSQVAFAIANLIGYPFEKSRKIRVAGLLHDMGKIAIPTEIIEKKGSLSETERTGIRTHAYFTSLILNHMEGLEEIAIWAAGHHENHDGSGYPKNLTAISITEEMDVVAYADIYTALSEDRPYRSGMNKEQIKKILHDEFIEKHGEKIYNVIIDNQPYVDDVCKKAVKEGIERFHLYQMNAWEQQKM
ncbi:MAG: HD domain-containing protein [Lachnospiraceae bacterium]|nr:HD domain-containing protein [Lachnospiraceae bacterium]